jgi:hypothetical protein
MKPTLSTVLLIFNILIDNWFRQKNRRAAKHLATLLLASHALMRLVRLQADELGDQRVEARALTACLARVQVDAADLPDQPRGRRGAFSSNQALLYCCGSRHP